jgi:hypothetical protein
MKKYFGGLALAIGVIAAAHSAATAGVVMTETETMVSGQPNGQQQAPRTHTLMIEGNKQKTIMEGGRSVITDLDKGTMLVIDPAQKSYFERPFPPRGIMGQAPGGPGPNATAFTKTGKSHTIAGYACDDYTGTGKFGMGDFTVIACMSSKAPGAKEYTKFQKDMMDKLKGTQLAMPTNMPEGIPLAQDTTTKMSVMNMPNLPPQAAEQLKKQFANRPPIVTKTEVSKVETRDLAASEFEVPAGFTKKEPAHPGMGGAMGGHMSGGASAGSSGAGAPGAGAPGAGAPPAAKP